MKLRNKKTGEIIREAEIAVRTRIPEEDEGETLAYDAHGEFTSIAELDENWEDYEPVEPLIEDQKARKVFQEWVKLYGAERFRATHFFNSKGHMTLLRSTDLTTEPSIELPGNIGKDSKTYTKIELVGEEKE